jgi:TfoX/Sxy family transcriptional regulator of competence genes
MKMKPASKEWTDAFDKALEGETSVERKKMFGYPAIFVNGNMAAGLHSAGLVLRLDESDRDALQKKGGAPFEPMKGRVMTGFMVAPQAYVSKNAELKKWLAKSIEHARSMPAKTRAAKSSSRPAKRPRSRRT